MLASLVSALVVTRVLAEWAASRPTVRRRPRLSGMTAGLIASAIQLCGGQRQAEAGIDLQQLVEAQEAERAEDVG